MKSVTVEATCAPADLEQAIALVAAQMPAIRAMPGCDHYTLYRDPTEPILAMIQRWDSLAAFDDYRASEAFMVLGQGLRPLMTAPPVTTIAEIDMG
ncbi:antibiotic biosynthesis monooxygenase [Yoonia sp. SS1-5]|uniref:Quinol monooxygenase n=1 Tax=Yoonia rhodophyticola TaxID=3137370 RepID=A0AAN0MLL3_9RHOB